jgi:hypothetical protein
MPEAVDRLVQIVHLPSSIGFPSDYLDRHLRSVQLHHHSRPVRKDLVMPVIIKCSRCGGLTPHEFVEMRVKQYRHYNQTTGKAGEYQVLEDSHAPILFNALIHKCSICGQERVYGSKSII